MNPNLEAFKRREETITIICGAVTTKFIVRELPTAADLLAIKDDPDYGVKVAILCTFNEDGVTPSFTFDDIPDIKANASLFGMADLYAVVHRVNGLNTKAEAKNSGAVPSGD